MVNPLARRKPSDIVFGDDLKIVWRDGTETHFPLFALRDACPCAGCVDAGEPAAPAGGIGPHPKPG